MLSTDIAKKLQNPIGDLYSFPFQNNTNFGFGPHHGTQDILNIQPVIPIHVNDDWNIITRTVLPVVWTPDLSPAPSVPFGTGPTTFSAFLSPAKSTEGWVWGLGPAVQVPPISSATLGSNVWGGGPTAVLVYRKGPWVAGVIANNIWSFGGTKGSGGTNYDRVARILQKWRDFNGLAKISNSKALNVISGLPYPCWGGRPHGIECQNWVVNHQDRSRP